MSNHSQAGATPDDMAGAGGRRRHGDKAPGEHRDKTSVADSIRAYLIGLGLAALLTAGSFWLTTTHLIYGPGVQMALAVFAIAQMGIHLVFFLHLTTAPDNINNAMALAFGLLIVLVLIGGTVWIMTTMNHNMLHTPAMTGGMQMPMQP